MDRFLATDRANIFAGLGFYIYLFRRDAQDVGDALADLFFVGAQFRFLGEHDAIDIHHGESCVGDTLNRQLQHIGGVSVAIDLLGIGEHITDVSQGCRSQDRVGNGVQKHIRIAMSDGRVGVRDVDAAQFQRPALLQSVGIMADSNANRVRNETLPILSGK